MKKIDPAYMRLIITLKKYAEDNKIPVERARYVLSFLHRFERPYNTLILNKMHKNKIIKLTNGSDKLEILI